MQNAKDSFYMALRTRLTAINPERTVLLRGAIRPGILVEEAEAPFSQLPSDVFVLRWLGLDVDADLGSAMAAAADRRFAAPSSWSPGGEAEDRLLPGLSARREDPCKATPKRASARGEHRQEAQRAVPDEMA